MSLLQEEENVKIKQLFQSMKEPVRILNFSQSSAECEYCAETRQLIKEIAALSEKISVEEYDLGEHTETADRYGVDKAPAIVLLGDRDYGIRYYGIPSGYEFVSLLQDILMVSKRDSGLQAGTRQKLAGLKQPLHLQVFVTPTCPYCPMAVRLAHQMAMESDLVVADMVEATEFPELARRHRVMGVPRTVGNEHISIEGALPEAHFINEILKGMSQGEVA